MGERLQMDPLDFLTNEELLRFFHCKKTEMSCMVEPPNIFLHQLRDNNMVPEELYKKVLRMKSKEKKKDGVYQILEWIEKERRNSIKIFWRCMFQDHILKQYPAISPLRNSLMDGSFKFYENIPISDDRPERENEPVQSKETLPKKKKGKKRTKNTAEAEDDAEPGPSSLSTPSHKTTPKKPKFSSPKKRGEIPDIWDWPLYKTTLPVTCGQKKGTLHRDKLARGGACIFSEGRWFTPAGFERCAGKSRNKNWKSSIRCQNITLQKIIEEGHLQSPREKRRSVKQTQKGLFHVSSSESSSPLSESSAEMDGSRDKDLDEQSIMEVEESSEEEENEDETEEDTVPLDPSVFMSSTLPVKCGCINGVLYRGRFATGLRGKCIRTEECWYTPEEFVNKALNMTDSHWKKDIMCHDKTFHYLLKKKVLTHHSLLCKCRLCSNKDQDKRDQDNDDLCFICNTEGDLVCCDECPRAFHHQCHLPPIKAEILGETWVCGFCLLKKYQSWRHTDLMREEVLTSPISQFTLHCEYLLMCLYKEDEEHVFKEDPRKTVSGYNRVISKPMWLDIVKENLLKQKYRTLDEFVSDVRLIFQNCLSFNRDNQVFYSLGSRLSEMFESEFQTIFNI
ncbi:nuclear body protein SP140-like protein [Hoplias malabaricus]|uniref:nuclear body protein SP140-like protein n=1 Tax=Hoplias malabaricus TaxID=27720 RepID=UPI003461E45C